MSAVTSQQPAPSDAETESYVDRIYNEVKAMALTYQLRPGERVNESTLSRQLNVSRTPLREALNRLRVEGFLETHSGKGFFRRKLDAQEIFDLYQLRLTVECGAVRLAVRNARDTDIDALMRFLEETRDASEELPNTPSLLKLDEHFHEELVRMSGNREMLAVLQNINARISFVRWIQIRSRERTQSEHRELLVALKARDTDACVAILTRHIERRMEQIVEVIRESYSRIYMGEHPQLQSS